jgi:hypothetical protein
LAYLNAFGVPETIICTGGVTNRTIVDAENYTSVRGAASSGNVLRSDRIVKNFGKDYLYRTGYLTSAQKEVLTELPLSPVLFDITNPQYIALVLKADRAQPEIIKDTEEYLYSYEWTVEPRIMPGSFAPENEFQNVPTLSEPVFRINKGNGSPLPPQPEVIDPIGYGGGGIGGNNTGNTSSFAWEQLTPIVDGDILLFAKTDQYGKMIGYRWLKSGDYMRHIRGLPSDTPSHLDGLTFKKDDGKNVTMSIDDNNSTDFQIEE